MGTGGEEAAYFAGDLFRMYRKYAEDQGWKVELLDANPTDHGGFKEISFSVTGEGVYQYLRLRERRSSRAARSGNRTARPHSPRRDVGRAARADRCRSTSSATISAATPFAPVVEPDNTEQNRVRRPACSYSDRRSAPKAEHWQHKNGVCAGVCSTVTFRTLQEERAGACGGSQESGELRRSQRTSASFRRTASPITINLTIYHLRYLIAGNIGEIVRSGEGFRQKQRLGQKPA